MEKLKLYQYFSQIPVPKELENDLIDDDGKQIELIDKLSQVNIFLGSNNSGKSRIIREIIRNAIKPIYFNEKVYEKINILIEETKEKFKRNYLNILRKIAGNSRSEYRNFDDSRFLKSELRFLHYNNKPSFNLSIIDSKLDDKSDIYILLTSIQEIINLINQSYDYYEIPSVVNGHLDNKSKDEIKSGIKYFEELIAALNNIKLNNTYQRIYISSQRSLKTVYKVANAKERITKEYSFNLYNEKKTVDNYAYEGLIVENGETLYHDILRNLTTGYKNKSKVTLFENFLSEYFFEGHKVELMPFTEGTQELHIKIGDEKEQPIFNLGDGLQMLIIITWPFFNYTHGIIALEEPELFIHPGLQKKLIAIFNSHPKAENFVFFISSHSNHIVDATHTSNNISVFTIKKRLNDEDSREKLPKFIIENVGFNNRDALSLIGVSNSSVYLANCSVWVEGITDKLYLSKFIDAYLDNNNPKRKDKYKDFKKYKEGTHYSFVLSGGSSIVHWDFDEASTYDTDEEKIIVKNLCGRAFVIVDRDNNKNIKRKKKFEEILGLRFYQLPVVEIENLLSFETVIKTIKSYPRCAELDEARMKSPTTKMMKDKSIGALIDNYILQDFKDEKIKKFKSKGSKTVTNKVDFCTKAIRHITPQNLSPNAIRIVERILDFVEEHNN